MSRRLNLANMLIIQGTARHREIAIRMAIGGGRLRIVRQLLIESLLLSLLGGALALVLAFSGTRILNMWMAAPESPLELASTLRVGFDVRVLAATLAFCLIASVLFGLKPALRLSHRDVFSDLKETGGGIFRPIGNARRFVPRGFSAICQIALSVVLVMGAAMFTHSALKALRPNPDFDLNGKLLVEIDPIGVQRWNLNVQTGNVRLTLYQVTCAKPSI